MAATTRHPSRYRRAAVAKPSPREAPVMTTLRASAILARARALARWRCLDVRAAVRFSARPGRPDAHRVRALRAGFLVIALRVIHFRFRIGPRAGHRGGGVADLYDPEPGAVGEVRHVDDGEHHQEGAQHRPGREDLGFGSKLFRDRLAGVVAVAQDRRGHHHEADRERLPDQRELERGTGKDRTPRNHLRVDVHAGVRELDLQPGVHDETDYEDDRAQAHQRVARKVARGAVFRLQLPKNPNAREVWAEVEHHVAEHHERFDGWRQRYQRP